MTTPPTTTTPEPIRRLAQLLACYPSIGVTPTTVTLSFGQHVARMLRQGDFTVSIDRDGDIVVTLDPAARVMSMFGSQEGLAP